jgi:RecA/RadA recombinase
LIRQIFAKREFAYPDDLAAQLDELARDPTSGVERLLEELQRVGVAPTQFAQTLTTLGSRAGAQEAASKNSLHVEECAALGMFPQSGSDLLHDYDGLLRDLAAARRPAAQLLSSARALCPAHLRSMLAEDGAEEPMDERPIATVVSSDPSQFAVLEEVRRNMAMVVDGPPGTGKSQVIVNLVADAIARGKRVAVVSEKRAALDVVAARLSDCGLSDSFALVHDVETDRKRLYAKLAGRLEAEAAPKPSAEAKARATSAVAQIKVELRSRAACLAKPVDGDGPTVGQIHVLVSGADAARAGISVDLGRTSTLTLLSLREHLSELSPFAAHLEPKSIWARDRASLARWANEDLTAFLAHVRLATDTAASLESLSQKFPGASAQALLASQAGVAAAREVVQHWDKSDALLWSAALLSRGDRGFDLEAANLVRTHQEHGAALERFDERVFFQVAEDESAAIAIGLKWSSRFWRFLSTSWWRAKPVLAQLLLRASQPATISTASIRNLATRVQAARGWQAIEGAFEHLAPRHLLPSRSSELGAFLRRMHSCTASVRGALSHRRVLSSISLWPQVSSLASSEGLTQAEQQLRSWAAQIELVRSIINALQEHRETAKPVADALPWLTALPPRDSLVEVARNFELDGVRLITMDRLLEAARTAHPEAPKLASWLADQSHGQAHDWPRCVTEAWGRARLRAVETEDPSVRALDGLTTRGEEADAGRELRKAETSVVEMTRRGLRAALDSTALRSVAQADKGARRTEDQKAREAILKECRKQRNLMPLRTFTRTFARQGALETLPVWLVSPETLSVLFEREPVFDCIIVDEASQVTVENGLPALLRGKRVVIAGDDKQMPPTSFFSAKTDDPDDEATDEADEETADAFSGESLLTLARSRCPHRGLAWHYRCVDEDLIAFSNHAMYAAGLYTIPSAGATVAGPAIRWESVAAGAFVKGRNVAEAERVVDVLDELLCRPVAPSVGVVTFNLQQKQAVLDAIDARRAASPEFARRIDAAMAAERIDERPFVKNLENVQGDERDVIVFSLGYAPAERTLKNGSVNRSVPARFGPLGLRGGERRLNVAISRAKRETVIVCSFEPELLSVAKTRNVGPRLLKEFLVFAKLSADGHRARAHSVLERVSEGTSTGAVRKARKLPLPGYLPLPIQLGEALAKRGHAWEAYVGRSRFQIPLAVAHSSDPSRYLVAVLTDEGDEPEVGVFERWVHRVRMLEARGWQVLLVHAREWLRGPDQVLLRIEASLERAQYLAQTAKTRDAAPAPVDTPVTVSTMGTARAPVAWADAFRTEELKSVFRHIETHGALGEEELVAMLGSPRAYRRFCVDIEDHLAKTPFGVRIDVVNGTKRYVREAKGS